MRFESESLQKISHVYLLNTECDWEAIWLIEPAVLLYYHESWTQQTLGREKGNQEKKTIFTKVIPV
jgi:hypothetical protein